MLLTKRQSFLRHIWRLNLRFMYHFMYHLYVPFLYTIFNVPFFKLEESSEATL